MARPKSPSSSEELLSFGLRNRWYAIAPSEVVDPGEVVKITRFGIDWVMFRQPNGALAILEDRCPHRGAPLSLGGHLGDRVQCVYHGVEVDANGTVVAVPGMPGCRLEGKQLTRSLPCKEHAGGIFAYLGDDHHPVPCEITFPAPITDPEYSSFLAYVEWKCPWRFAVENVLDPSHGAFLHRKSHSMALGDFAAEYRIVESDDGFLFEKTTQRDVNFDWVAFRRSGVDWLELTIPYPASGGPGGPFGIVGMVTPITEERSAIFFWRYRKLAGWQRDSWRFLYKTTIEERHFEVLEQDRVLLEAMASDADRYENVYQHDLGLARYRRLVRNEAREQAESLAGTADI